MSVLCIYCVIAFLCCNSQLEVVWAKNNTFGSNDLAGWTVSSYLVGTGEFWKASTTPELRLHTEIDKTSASDPPGESWFITPAFENSNISYLDIIATPSECDGKPSCNLTIYGTTKTFTYSDLPVPNDVKKREFIDNNFEHISTMTFILGNRTRMTTAVITKSYKRLAIFTEKTLKAKTTWDIYSIKLYYYFCENTTINKINVNQTNSYTTDLSVQGVCSNNAVLDGKTNITVKCSVKGEWIVGKDQKCYCDKGFGLDNLKCLGPTKQPSNIKPRSLSSGSPTKKPSNTKPRSLSSGSNKTAVIFSLVVVPILILIIVLLLVVIFRAKIITCRLPKMEDPTTENNEVALLYNDILGPNHVDVAGQKPSDEYHYTELNLVNREPENNYQSLQGITSTENREVPDPNHVDVAGQKNSDECHYTDLNLVNQEPENSYQPLEK